MTERQTTCATCKWFKPVEDGRFMSGGWCDWREPMKLRHILWGAYNQRIPEPEKDWCAEHVHVIGETSTKPINEQAATNVTPLPQRDMLDEIQRSPGSGQTKPRS